MKDILLNIWRNCDLSVCVTDHLCVCRGSLWEKQDAQLSRRDRAAGCVTVFAKSRRLELGDDILRTL